MTADFATERFLTIVPAQGHRYAECGTNVCGGGKSSTWDEEVVVASGARFG
jgi:hypothetical protein